MIENSYVWFFFNTIACGSVLISYILLLSVVVICFFTGYLFHYKCTTNILILYSLVFLYHRHLSIYESTSVEHPITLVFSLHSLLNDMKWSTLHFKQLIPLLYITYSLLLLLQSITISIESLFIWSQFQYVPDNCFDDSQSLYSLIFSFGSHYLQYVDYPKHDL